MRHRLFMAAPALVVLLAAPPARALDPFEIQVYDGTANAPRVFGLELHLNRVATGYGSAAPPELPLRGQTHFTLEPSFGLFPWWEVGAYLQTALRADGHFDWAGVKLRSKFVTPPSFHKNLRFGVNLELAYLPPLYDKDRYSGEIRPIAAWEGSGWLVVVNPIVGVGLAGESLRDGPTFEPAAKLSRSVREVFAIGVEYYGSVGHIASPPPIAGQIHQLFGVVDVEAFHDVEVEVGMGGGVTAAGAGLIGKVILGYSFDVTKVGAGARR